MRFSGALGRDVAIAFSRSVILNGRPSSLFGGPARRFAKLTLGVIERGEHRSLRRFTSTWISKLRRLQCSSREARGASPPARGVAARPSLMPAGLLCSRITHCAPTADGSDRKLRSFPSLPGRRSASGTDVGFNHRSWKGRWPEGARFRFHGNGWRRVSSSRRRRRSRPARDTRAASEQNSVRSNDAADCGRKRSRANVC